MLQPTLNYAARAALLRKIARAAILLWCWAVLDLVAGGAMIIIGLYLITRRTFQPGWPGAIWLFIGLVLATWGVHVLTLAYRIRHLHQEALPAAERSIRLIGTIWHGGYIVLLSVALLGVLRGNDGAIGWMLLAVPYTVVYLAIALTHREVSKLLEQHPVPPRCFVAG